MSARTGNSVWLIGAGFPQSLGAPLLDQLFVRQSEIEIEPFFPDDLYPGLANDIGHVQALYEEGEQKKHWQNAEQFLAYVDDACGGGSVAKGNLLTRLLQQSSLTYFNDNNRLGEEHDANLWCRLNDGLDKRVRRALAAECTRFTRDMNVKSELWSPYVAWVGSLEPGKDTVIGFNYDTAVELADVEGKVEVVLPDAPLPTKKVPYLKLHGSANWIVFHETGGAQPSITNVADVKDALIGDDEIAIAAPGASKAAFCEKHLNPLWVKAEEALAAARYVNLVGYSFPATDPRAQSRLLEAMRRYDSGQGVQEFHVVLGSDINSPASRRMLALLRSVGGRREVYVNGERSRASSRDEMRIRQHPLWAQDYLLRYRSFEI